MLAISFNPGFVLLFAALAVLGAPQKFRPPIMGIAAAIAMWLMLDRDFGNTSAVARMGLTVVLLNLDPLSQVFGIAFIAALLLIALYSSARRNRFEDAAILLLAGGAVSALFVGDLLSFVAAASVAGLAAVWVVLASPEPGANGAGVRLLIWHGLEGLLFLAGVAFHLSVGAAKADFSRLDATSIGGGFIFAALMIRIGAPIAHVWLKDAVSHASGAGAVALSVFTTMFGVYALARMFPAEPILIGIGMAMMLVGAVYAVAEDDLRRAAASVLTAQTGLCVALVGVGSPQALAGAEATAFTSIFAFALVQMALGAMLTKRGAPRASGLAGLGRAMPVSVTYLLLGGLTAAGAPGLAGYISAQVALAATAQWEHRLLWALIVALGAVTLAALVVRPAVLGLRPAERRPPFDEAPFAMQLAAALAGFFCIAIGFNPTWLYLLLLEHGLVFAPFALDRLAPALETLGAAGATYVILRTVRVLPAERRVRVLDLDSLYRGPMAWVGRHAGGVLLRVYRAIQMGFDAAGTATAVRLAAWARACDRPYAERWAPVAQLTAIAAVLAIVLLTRR